MPLLIFVCIRHCTPKFWRLIDCLKIVIINAPQVGTGSVPYKTRGLGSWIANYGGDQTVGSSIYASELSPSSDQTLDVAGSGTPKANELTESTLQGLLEAIYNVTGRVRSYDFICGTKIKRFVTELTSTAVESVASTASTAATSVRTFNKELNNTVFKNTVQVFEGDFGPLTLLVDAFTPNAYTGFVIPMEMAEIRYGMLPRVQTIPNSGSGEGRIVEAVASLVVRNPKGFGKVHD